MLGMGGGREGGSQGGLVSTFDQTESLLKSRWCLTSDPWRAAVPSNKFGLDPS